MLRDDVIEAVVAGTFHIHPVSRVEEGIEILTGVAAGARRDARGRFEPETVFARVDERLRDMARTLKNTTRFPFLSGRARGSWRGGEENSRRAFHAYLAFRFFSSSGLPAASGHFHANRMTRAVVFLRGESQIVFVPQQSGDVPK